MERAITQTILEKFLVLEPLLDERTQRLWAATEAQALGRGGITRVAEATGMSRSRIHAGLREIESAGPGGLEAGRRRAEAGGGEGRGSGGGAAPAGRSGDAG